MAIRRADRAPLLKQRWTPSGKLLKQMLPLIFDLACRDKDGCIGWRRPDLGTVEGIATRSSLGVNFLQVATDRETRRGLRAKTVKLRMISIAPSVSAKDCASQQCLSPQGDEALAIEVPRMQ